MLDFTTWFIMIAVICVASLLIDARRSHKVVDNLPEYRKMFDQGILHHRERKKLR
ncbi:MAG: hypothetical protein RRA35_02145 [Desulfomonilia bacterium]|nr:hypothetical protein [Desulfomonilia bacterium]